jgi:hypothetical protein
MPRQRISKKDLLETALAGLPDLKGPYPTGPTRWLRISQLPFSRGLAYHLITLDLLFSVAYRVPGSKRIVRLVDGESLDRYLIQLGTKQAAEAKANPKPPRTIGIKKPTRKAQLEAEQRRLDAQRGKESPR